MNSELPAVDREALAEWLYTELEWQGDPDSHWESLRSQDLYRWRAIAGQLLEHWGILDAAAVRHEHGERIVRAIDEQGTWIGPMTKREVIRIIAQTTAARDLSPAPETKP